MSAATHPTSLHERVEKYTDGDMRLLYGLGIPAAVVVGLVVVLALTGFGWMVPVAIVGLVLLIGIVVVGIAQMLEDDDREEA